MEPVGEFGLGCFSLRTFLMFFFFSFYRNYSLESFGFLLNQLQISIIIFYFFIFFIFDFTSKKELKVIGVVIYGSGTDYFLPCKLFYFIFFFFT